MRGGCFENMRTARNWFRVNFNGDFGSLFPDFAEQAQSN